MKTAFVYILAQHTGENELFIHGVFASMQMIKRNIIKFDKKYKYEILKFPINRILTEKSRNKDKTKVLNNLNDYGCQYFGTFGETLVTRDKEEEISTEENQKVIFWPNIKSKRKKKKTF